MPRFRVRFQAGIIFGFAIHLMFRGPDFPPGLVVIQRFRGAEVVGFDIEYAKGLVDDGKGLVVRWWRKRKAPVRRSGL
ncbi:MAG: hypothetical protein P8X74_16895 [Reinekea sp.]